MFDLEDEQKNYVIVGLLLVVLVLIAGTFYFYQGQSCVTGDELSAEEAKTKAAQFINNNLMGQGQSASIENVTSTESLYKLGLKVQDQDYESYMTKDGSLFFTQGYNMTQSQDGQDQAQNQNKEIPQKETPDFKFFTMAYCPYGLQTTKAYLPVYDLLKDEADMGIYFVDYAMHDKKELKENMRQYCIQKKQSSKYADYLKCFTKSGESEQCQEQVGINQQSLSSCTSRVDQEYKVMEKYNDKSTWVSGQFPKFPVQSDLNEKYGVGGSPTFIVNATKTSPTSRSPEAIKNLLCEAFKEKPEECSQTLSKEVPSTGFGGGTSNSSGGSCE